MKRVTLIVSIFILFSQFNLKNYIFGTYKSYHNGKLVLNEDSTYHYSMRFDLMYSWTSGNWKYKNDTINLTPITVYDTLRYYETEHTLKDTLVKSQNEIPEVISIEMYALLSSSSGQQDLYNSPKKLLYKNEKLYYLKKNGNVIKKKFRGIWSKKKHPSYFKKINE